VAAAFEVTGSNDSAPFSLKLRRGEGMVLLAMDWRNGKPPREFVGFAIEFEPPGLGKFLPVWNRLSFLAADGGVDPVGKPSLLSPIQKFRWVHFPRDAEVDGEFVYRVTPVSMDDGDELSYGEAQIAAIELGGETYPGKLNVAFTRGFVSSQAFVDEFQGEKKEHRAISDLLPRSAKQGLTFVPTHPDAARAYDWMGFEARRAVLAVLDGAIADTKAEVRVVAYDLSQPEIVTRLEQLGSRLKVIVDDSPEDHDQEDSPEKAAEERLRSSAGKDNVKRQKMGGLQHNKTIVVDGPAGKAVVCGSTNFSWRGFFVQANNAIVLHGDAPAKAFADAFEGYWHHETPSSFGALPAAELNDLGLDGIDARLAFSPHASDNALLARIGSDVATDTTSSLFYSLAFLFQTKGPIRDAITKVTEDEAIFVYGISDKDSGLDLQRPTDMVSGNVPPTFPVQLDENVPEPFKKESAGGGGIRLHHKFLVVDFDKPTARVYMGSYNFSEPADLANGENLLVIEDRRIAVAYAVEALRIFDHYHFRVARQQAKDENKPLVLARAPREPDELPWWDQYYSVPQKIRDREIFA
jgi:phosphatidylserine/phosphatidylglycerophosphate/cardiolipin synthase-like enzyme